MWKSSDPQGNECDKVKYDVAHFLRGVVLDLGCGPKKVFPHVVGVDSCKDTELFGIDMRPDLRVNDCADLADFLDGCADAVFSSHLLEHLPDPQAALREWWRTIKVGGHLVLYLPHRDLYPNIGTPGANPDHKHDFVPLDVIALLQDVAEAGMDIVMNEVRDAGTEYSFLLVVQKRDDGLYPNSAAQPKPDKTVCISRFGGFGDLLQAANLLPELKRQGYHVVFNTTPKGQNILRHDPHIDDWIIVDEDLVPNPELPLYWAALARRHTKFIQLSESIEGTLLAMPGRANHLWPDAVRRAEMDKNYLEWTAQLAEIPYVPEAKFYPSHEELAIVEDELFELKLARATRTLGRAPRIGETLPDCFFIMWALAGSSMHKFMPWQDNVIARILRDMPEAIVLLSGDDACRLLECGWELEPRVVAQSGRQDIRMTLAQATRVDCVVGPETGILNAVAFEPVEKVLFLSHSSKNNLSRDWTNCATLEPVGVDCFPCHRLHFGKQFCREDADTGAAACQVAITPGRIYDAIHAAYVRWKSKE